MTSTSSLVSRAPALSLLACEPLRAFIEFGSMAWRKRSAFPAGDAHPVIIFPGLASNGLSTAPLRSFVNALGYSAHDWGRGFNTGPRGDVGQWLDALAQSVVKTSQLHGTPASLIGWSLGGFYAREVAKRVPQAVRRVVTIGTPFASIDEQSPAGRLYKLLNRRAVAPDAQMQAQLRQPPPLPTTSIYSRSDGVVSWQACTHATGGPLVDDVEVNGSHCGMGWNPQVLAVIADRLAKPAL